MAVTGDGAATEPDVRLVERIAAGERAAEAEFVRRYERGVRMLVRRHSRPCDPSIDDVAQDVLATVIEKLRGGALRDGTALAAYVRTAVVHATTAEYRSRRNTTALDESLPASDDVSQSLERDQMRERLVEGIQSLGTPRDREVLVRFYLREQEKEEVCAALGIDEAHFRRVLFRARERLRDQLVAGGLEATW